eukprot:TRINITY_DN2310_c0_g1_i1.p1 TRINITY_DN2310_c0_g1~~TRINITY_DN2310_c0_g1_i1.p1  ORF type:complete len:157 (-),score=11.56 TRINITY_DN2310_c0_g1_i1:127-597(-)
MSDRRQTLRVLVFISAVILMLMLILLWVGFGVGKIGGQSVGLTLLGTILLLIIPAIGLYALYKKDETWLIKYVIGCFIMFLLQLLSTIFTGVAKSSQCDDPSTFWSYFCDTNTVIFVITCIIVFTGTLMGMIFGYILYKDFKDTRENKEEANVYLY